MAVRGVSLDEDIRRIRAMSSGAHMNPGSCACLSCACQRVANAAEKWLAYKRLRKSSDGSTDYYMETMAEGAVATYRREMGGG